MSDNMHDIDRLLRNGQQSSGMPLILPGAGLFCPECGFEVKRLPDGNTSDTVFFTLGGIETPHYHANCAQGALMTRDAAYLASHVRPLAHKTEAGEFDVWTVEDADQLGLWANEGGASGDDAS